MTDERYTWWCGEISKARAEKDSHKLSTLQLDYNLELGSCLAHQSQRTKDIKAELLDVKTTLGDLGDTVTRMDGSVSTLEAAVTRTNESVDKLATNVRELIDYRNSAVNKREGFKLAWYWLWQGLGVVAVLAGWAYATYQAVLFFSKGS
jgi:chromosome segregation ATPase